MSGPQSVVVPVEPTREMLNAAIDVDSFKLGDISPLGFRISPQMLFEKCWSAMLAAAPAPSSLAGGEVWAALEPFAKVADTALCPSDEPDDNDFIRLDETIAITVADIRRAASVFADLSPEAPAREGECITTQSMNDAVSDPEWCAKWNRDPSALTPRHEAPASEGNAS